MKRKVHAFTIIVTLLLTTSVSAGKSAKLSPRILTQSQQKVIWLQELTTLMFHNAEDTHDLYRKYIRPLTKNQPKSRRYFQRLLAKNRPLPHLRLSPNRITFSYNDQQKVTLDVVDFDKHQFKVNGELWVLDPHAPFHINAEGLRRKVLSKNGSNYSGISWLLPRAEAAVPAAVWVISIASAAAVPLIQAGTNYFLGIFNAKDANQISGAGLNSREIGISLDEAMACLKKGFDHPESATCRRLGFLPAELDRNSQFEIIGIPSCVSKEQPYTEYYEEIKGYSKSGRYVIIHYPEKESLPSDEELKAPPRSKEKEEKEERAKEVVQQAKEANAKKAQKNPDAHPPFLMEYYTVRNGKVTDGHVFAVGVNPINSNLEYFEKAYAVQLNEGTTLESVRIDQTNGEKYKERLKALLLNDRVKPYFDYSENANIENERIQDGFTTYYKELEKIVDMCNRAPEQGFTGLISEYVETTLSAQEEAMQAAQEKKAAEEQRKKEGSTAQ